MPCPFPFFSTHFHCLYCQLLLYHTTNHLVFIFFVSSLNIFGLKRIRKNQIHHPPPPQLSSASCCYYLKLQENLDNHCLHRYKVWPEVRSGSPVVIYQPRRFLTIFTFQHFSSVVTRYGGISLIFGSVPMYGASFLLLFNWVFNSLLVKQKKNVK